MTQTPSRDWQKDMETADKLKSWDVDPGGEETPAQLYTMDEDGIYPEIRADNLLGTDAELILEGIQALPHWLHEAKERGEREQRLKETVETAIQLYDMGESSDVYPLLKDLISTLYPDTPAPKEGTENKCPGCGSHMVPQWGGDEGPDSQWEECQNPDCEFEEGDNQ